MSQTQGLKRTRKSAGARTPVRAWRQAVLSLGIALPLAAWAQASPTVPGVPTARNAARPPAAPASVPTIVEAEPVVENSYLDGALLKQLLLAEFALRDGQPGDAVELILEAARENHDDALFRRAFQIAVESGGADKALAITKTWHQSMPKSTEAVRTEVQLLFALDRVRDAADPLEELLSMSTPAERSALISSLPRAAQRAQDKQAAAEQFRALLKPYLDAPDTRTAAHVALGRMRLAEGNAPAALELAAQAQASDPKALAPVLLALDVMNTAGDTAPARAAAPAPSASDASPSPAPLAATKDAAAAADTLAKAEVIVRAYLAQPDAEPLVRQAFAGVLAGQQRLSDSADQLRLATQARPKQAQLWLGLGEIELELHHADAADAALKKALELVTAEQAEQAAAADKAEASARTDAQADDDTPADDTAPPTSDTDAATGPARLAHIRLQLARAAEQRHDDVAAEKWLSEVDAKDADLQVVSLRASLLARHGKLTEALALIRAAPAATPAEQRYKLLTEVQLLLDEKKLSEARNVLTQANTETPDDVDLIYQEAMVDERLNKLDDMELLLRRILVLQPDNSQALNALGYSLADRNLRLDEALGLVKQAHDLSPADPFIVDSLGWVEYRMGHYGEATTLLAQANASRKDTEIAAHLAEALWAQGKRDEAAQVLRDAHRLDAGNEVLKQTMARLKVSP